MRSRRMLMLVFTMAALVGCGGGGGGSSSGGSGGGGGGGGSGGTTNSGTAIIGGNPAGSASLPLIVLIGGSTRPQGERVYLDTYLDNGEIFILPEAPLVANDNYTVAVSATAGPDSFSHTWTFQTASVVLPTTQATKLEEINHLRLRSGVSTVVDNAGYRNSALKHAGYQSETAALSHYEPDNTKRFFVNNDFSQRITAGVVANGGSGWDGATSVSEDVASNGGLPAISLLWDSVYHRIPMMRTSTSFLGIADRSDAYTHALNSPQVITNSSAAYLTINFGGNNSAAQVQSYWPHDLETDVHYTFNTNSESPDPLGTNPSLSIDPNDAPAFNTVGTPIHVILPTTQNFTGLTITLILTP